MTDDMIIIGVGAILVLIGVLGGGFEIKEIRLPQFSMIVRVIATFIGFGFVGLGVWMKMPASVPIPPSVASIIGTQTQTLSAPSPPARTPDVVPSVREVVAPPSVNPIPSTTLPHAVLADLIRKGNECVASLSRGVGTLLPNTDYKVRYTAAGNEYVTTGTHRSSGVSETYSYSNAVLNNNEITLWGANMTFTEDGSLVYDGHPAGKLRCIQ